jgi:hypothetical protein
MIDTPTSNNIADFKQRYSGVFGWLLSEGVKKLVYISGVNSKQVTFTDAEGGNYFANINAGVEFEFAPVMRGWYNTPEGVFYMCRIPARQWKRGVCVDNTHVGAGGSPDYQLVGDAWNKAVFSILSVSNPYKINDLQYTAYSKHFANVYGRLYLYTKPIGVVVDNHVKLASPLFRQEFMDMCRRRNLEMVIE